jgi:hypothetical protein
MAVMPGRCRRKQTLAGRAGIRTDARVVLRVVKVSDRHSYLRLWLECDDQRA